MKVSQLKNDNKGFKSVSYENYNSKYSSIKLNCCVKQIFFSKTKITYQK